MFGIAQVGAAASSASTSFSICVEKERKEGVCGARGTVCV
jgi:hypothetical protein